MPGYQVKSRVPAQGKRIIDSQKAVLVLGCTVLTVLCCLWQLTVIASASTSPSSSPDRVAAGPVLENMAVQGADVREVLTSLAQLANENIALDESVSGTITVQLKQVSFSEALEIITRLKGLKWEKVGSVIVVASAEKIGRNFGDMHYFPVQYADAGALKDSMNLLFLRQPALSAENAAAQKPLTGQEKQGTGALFERLKVDTATNTIMLQGTKAEAAQLRAMLQELDVPQRQVTLEAQVVAVSRQASASLGVEWQWDKFPKTVDYAATSKSVNPDGSVDYLPGKVSRQSVLEQPGIIQFGHDPEGRPYELYFQAKINALVANGDAKILARPKITAINGREAKILIGDRIPVVTEKKDSNGQTTAATEYIDAGIKLTYTPRIHADGQISAAVHTEVSSPTLTPEMKAYRITTREAQTDVRMKDGETMVIGGLIGSVESDSRQGVPFLQDLPVLGVLFKSSTHLHEDTEVIIFLTARIVK